MGKLTVNPVNRCDCPVATGVDILRVLCFRRSSRQYVFFPPDAIRPVSCEKLTVQEESRRHFNDVCVRSRSFTPVRTLRSMCDVVTWYRRFHPRKCDRGCAMELDAQQRHVFSQLSRDRSDDEYDDDSRMNE
ncbi:PREDICTED: uncharacterized protein LOC108747805 [Trachymyrmex septentrionalis]|uniref:uncharacterized protein LOC108747805 n=1 Tax=Trachymyrmex septentrionalis TaxID=34720 RepID=UPI00084EE418|nr:PREDICTED: uncharacterized protein LOC108747805 [Trachymyrmex septentrionalis]